MYFEARTAWIPKDLEVPADYEDAFAIAPERGAAAIADGVSSGMFSGRWAKLLTEGVVQQPPDLTDGASFADWLAGLRKAWQESIDPAKLTWYMKPKLSLGGFSTLLWVEPAPAEEGDPPGTFRYKSYATGDSCLFHTRGNQLLRWFPLTTSEEFKADPMTIGSKNRNRDHLLEFQRLDGVAESGDCLILCTDALACWLLTQHERGVEIPWQTFWERTEQHWHDEIIVLRQEKAIRVDDTTVIVLQIGALAPVETPLPEEMPPAEATVESIPAAQEIQADEAPTPMAEEAAAIPEPALNLSLLETAELASPPATATNATEAAPGSSSAEFPPTPSRRMIDRGVW